MEELAYAASGASYCTPRGGSIAASKPNPAVRAPTQRPGKAGPTKQALTQGAGSASSSNLTYKTTAVINGYPLQRSKPLPRHCQGQHSTAAVFTSETPDKGLGHLAGGIGEPPLQLLRHPLSRGSSGNRFSGTDRATGIISSLPGSGHGRPSSRPSAASSRIPKKPRKTASATSDAQRDRPKKRDGFEGEPGQPHA